MVWVLEGAGGFSFLEAHHPGILIGPADSGTVLPHSVVLPPEGSTVLLVTGYEQAQRFLTDPPWSRAAAAGRQPVGPASAMSVTELDPPRHTSVRGMVNRAFSPRAVERLHGIFAELLTAHDCARLTSTELTGLASSLFFDGHILATAQIANAVLGLLCRPGQLRMATESPGALGPAVEELLRWSPSITLGMPRLACTALEIGDRRVEPGQAAAVAFGLVNHDRTVFGEPHRLDLNRSPNRHLSFGRGNHHCLGAYLMRLELHTALETLLHGLPDLALAVDEHQLTWSASHTVRRLHRLPLKWTTSSGYPRSGCSRGAVPATRSAGSGGGG